MLTAIGELYSNGEVRCVGDICALLFLMDILSGHLFLIDLFGKGGSFVFSPCDKYPVELHRPIKLKSFPKYLIFKCCCIYARGGNSLKTTTGPGTPARFKIILFLKIHLKSPGRGKHLLYCFSVGFNILDK